MNLHTVITLLFLFSLFVEHNGIEFGSNLSEEEDLELEKQLKLLNKPAVKTIKTEYGDIYDCIDFYKQPAFDHPLLKNHTFDFKMKPISLSEGRSTNQVYSNITNILLDQKREEECPIGTVPIRRTTKEDLVRERLASTMLPSTANAFGPHYAVIWTRPGPANYAGAGAYVSIHRPGAVDKQYSVARLKIQNGPDSIQVGWRAGQSHCFNTRCPGFVVTNQKIALGRILKYSERGDSVWEMWFYIIRVGAGLPIIASLNRMLSSGDPIHHIVGSLSGTLGYVMSEVEDGKPFSQVVRSAKSVGYTEPVVMAIDSPWTTMTVER